MADDGWYNDIITLTGERLIRGEEEGLEAFVIRGLATCSYVMINERLEAAQERVARDTQLITRYRAALKFKDDRGDSKD